MAIPARAALVAELHCLTHNQLFILTAQRWSDPAAPDGRPRSWVRLVRNGKVVQDCQFAGTRQHRELERFWAERTAAFAPTALPEDRMWVKLRELTGIEQALCQHRECVGALPVARWFCPECHRDARRVAHGSMSGARRRGDIQMAPVRGPETR